MAGKKHAADRRASIGGTGLEVADREKLHAAIDAMRKRVGKLGEEPTPAEFQQYLLKLGFNRALTLEKDRAKRNAAAK